MVLFFISFKYIYLSFSLVGLKVHCLDHPLSIPGELVRAANLGLPN